MDKCPCGKRMAAARPPAEQPLLMPCHRAMLCRGRDPASMAGLRVRLANSFLQFAQSEHFNPQATAAKPAAIRQHQQQQQYRFTERNARMAGQQGDAWQQAQGGGVVAAATSTAAR